MSNVLAIDPGNTESGWCVIDTETCEPIDFGKWDNTDLIRALRAKRLVGFDHAAIEMVASYGMSVGASVFETCVWIGRFDEALADTASLDLVKRLEVKMHVCGQTKATDSNIRQALVDRFAPGERNHGKGTKAEPGFFYGFKADVWQSYALAVLVADRIENRPGVAA